MGYRGADRPTKNSIAGWNLDKMKQNLSIYLSLYLSIYLSIHPSIHLSTYPSIYMCVCVVGCFDSFWMSQSMYANQPGLLMPRAENIGTFVSNITLPYSHTIVRYWHPWSPVCLFKKRWRQPLPSGNKTLMLAQWFINIFLGYTAPPLGWTQFQDVPSVKKPHAVLVSDPNRNIGKNYLDLPSGKFNIASENGYL